LKANRNHQLAISN